MTRTCALRLVVAGMVASVPRQGGATWAVLQYLLGLRRLGHSVFFVEQVPDGGDLPLVRTPNAAWCRRVMRRFDLDESWAIVNAARAVAGASHAALAAACAGADILIDLSGRASGVEEAMAVPVRLYVDLDPGFTQAWHAQGIDVGLADHTHYATVGTAIGTDACQVPTLGIRWLHTLPPVVLDEWPVAGCVERDSFTTVGYWRSYGAVRLGDSTLGQRAHAMRALCELPRRAPASFAVALAIDPGDASDIALLRAHGWRLLDPRRWAGSPDAYRRFVSTSAAEIGVPKHGYASARTGWVSDRSVCYLASGRPVVTQDTGAVTGIACDEGLLSYRGLDDAAEAVARVRREPRRHGRAARRLAEDAFDSDRVLTRLLASIGAA